jgi:Tol biopolymer transport system component
VSGVIAHRPSGAQWRQLSWVGRDGKTLGTLGPPDENGLANPALAQDGDRLLVNRVMQGNMDLWLMDVTRGVLSRFTFDDGIDNSPVWSRDGRWVVFRSTRKGAYDLFEKPASGTVEEQPLLETAENKTPNDWSPDGRTLLYVTVNPKTGPDLWALPTASSTNELRTESKPFPFALTSFEDADGQFSPDGRWVAYESNESGRFEIYVAPFPGPGGKKQVSTAGGSQPRWRRDGKELFYAAPDGHMMAASVSIRSDGQALEVSTPVTLFAARLASGASVLAVGAQRPQYAIAPDGRFLMNLAVDAPASPISVVLNWNAALKP